MGRKIQIDSYGIEEMHWVYLIGFAIMVTVGVMMYFVGQSNTQLCPTFPKCEVCEETEEIDCFEEIRGTIAEGRSTEYRIKQVVGE